MPIYFKEDIYPREDLSPERAIYLKESDYNFLCELLDPMISRCRANAERCLTGYGSVNSKMKHDEWLEKADRILALMTKMGEGFI